MGRRLPWSKIALEIATGNQIRSGGVTVLGMAEQVSAENGIFANSVLGQSTLAEDVHPASLVHPGSIVIPAALAAAERVDATGREFLRAVVAGYDVACAVGAALKTEAFVKGGFRPSGIFGALGAAAAAAHQWGFNETNMASCLGIAGNMGAGLREWATAGTTDIYVQNGVAARNGFHAALLTERGFTGPRSVFDGPVGMGQASAGGSVDWAELVAGCRRRAAVHDVQFKRFPACSAVQTVLELAVSMAGRVRPQDIEKATVYTHRHGKRNPGCDSQGPWSDVGQAQMSNQLGVALALSGAGMSVDDYARGLSDPQVCELARRIDVVEDPGLAAAYPGRSGARIDIVTRAGVRSAQAQAQAQALAQASPLTVGEVKGLARTVVRNAIPDTQVADQLSETLFDIPQVASIRSVTKLIRGMGATSAV